MLLPRDLPANLLQQRSLYTTPPPARSSRENNPTLLVSWWCTGFALAIIIVRLAGRYIRTERLFREDKIMALSIIPLLARMGFVHVILLFGTNNALVIDASNPEDITSRAIGSRLVLVSRIMYAAFLWIAKFTISEFLKRLTSQVWRRSYELGLRFIRYFLLVTFLAVVIATISECQPFRHYWQVVPDPGPKCRQGVAQLITMGTSDIITDLLLIVFPIPIVLKSTMPFKRKLSLVLLFALSLILVAITLYRVIAVIDRQYEQQFRSLLASLEILAAAAVSNALVLGSFVRDRGTKKQRWRHGGSMGGHSSLEQRVQTPRRTVTQRNWGSDADLVSDLGISCAPELSEKGSSTGPRPAPIALPSGKHAKNLTPGPTERPGSEAILDKEQEKPGISREQHLPSAGLPTTPKGPSFFDVGGLLGDDDHVTRSRHPSVALPEYRNFSRPNSPIYPTSMATLELSGSAGSSSAFLADVGGLISPNTLPPENRPAHAERSISLNDVLRETGPNSTHSPIQTSQQHKDSPPEIQDAGGLLSPLQRLSTSDKRSISLKDVLRETGPTESTTYKSPSLAQKNNSPPEIQDIGGLLSPKQDRSPIHSASNDVSVSVAHDLPDLGPTAPNQQQ